MGAEASKLLDFNKSSNIMTRIYKFQVHDYKYMAYIKLEAIFRSSKNNY